MADDVGLVPRSYGVCLYSLVQAECDNSLAASSRRLCPANLPNDMPIRCFACESQWQIIRIR